MIASWLLVAQKELDIKEVPGPKHNPRIVEYHQTCSMKAVEDEVPWCSAFVNWCMKEVGIQGTGSAAAKSWISWGEEVPEKEGCVVIICNKAGSHHVGFLLETTNTSITILGGNQADSVRISKFPKGRWQIKGLRWPKEST